MRSRRNWRTYRPSSIRDAIEATVEHGRDRRNLSVERIADLLSLDNHYRIYKWIKEASIPARYIAALEHACGACYVTQYLAGSAHKLLIEIPTGRKAEPADIAALQEASAQAVSALVAYAQGHGDADATAAALTRAMERCAIERGHVERGGAPELDLFSGDDET